MLCKKHIWKLFLISCFRSKQLFHLFTKIVNFNSALFFLKGVFAKNERGYRLTAIKSAFDRSNLTSICCVYKEKIVKNDSYQRTYYPYKFRKLQYSTSSDLKKSIVFSARCLCHVNHSKHREQRHLAANYFGVLSALYIKQIKNILRYKLYTNASKNNRRLLIVKSE